MPIVVPYDGIDPKMLLKVPESSIDYKMIVQAPEVKSVNEIKAFEPAK